MTQAIKKQTLYDRDLNLWLETAIAQLRSGDLNNLDIDHVIEELEGLAGRDRREIVSRLKTLIEHILQRCYVDLANEFRGWEVTIRHQRFELRQILKQSPSLRAYFVESFDRCFRNALEDVQEDYLPQNYLIPQIWQFSRSIDDVLTTQFWE